MDDTTLVTLRQQAVATFGGVVAGLEPEDLTRPTLCTTWDVRQVLTRAGEMCATMLRGLDGEPARGPSPAGGGVDPTKAAAFARRMQSRFQEPGALDLPWGESRSRDAIDLIRTDLTLHTWEVTRAVRADLAIDEDVAAASLAFTQDLLSPEMRTPEMGFEPEFDISEDAPTMDRLAAFTGREP